MGKNSNISSMFSANLRSESTKKEKVVKEEKSENKAAKKKIVRKEAPFKARDIQNNVEAARSYEQYLEQESLKESTAADTYARRSGMLRKATKALMIGACVYLILLIYGVAVTDFSYDNSGIIKPQVLSVSDIKEKKQFEIILGQYQMCRILYEKTLLLDYRIAQGIEDPRIIAPDYMALMETAKVYNVKNLVGKTEALSVDEKYGTLKNMMLAWLKSDISVYIDYVSNSITTDNGDLMNEALQYRDATYSDFSLITQNLVSIGESLNGVDVTDIKNWSPENYIDDYINGGT